MKLKATEGAFYYGLSKYPICEANLRSIPEFDLTSLDGSLAMVRRRLKELCGAYELPMLELSISYANGKVRIMGDGFIVKFCKE